MLSRKERDAVTWIGVSLTYDETFSCYVSGENGMQIYLQDGEAILTGIEYFDKITELYIKSDKKNDVGPLLKKFSIGNLKRLSLEGCQAGTLNMSKAKKLEELSVKGKYTEQPRIRKIDVTKNKFIQLSWLAETLRSGTDEGEIESYVV